MILVQYKNRTIRVSIKDYLSDNFDPDAYQDEDFFQLEKTVLTKKRRQKDENHYNSYEIIGKKKPKNKKRRLKEDDEL